VTVIGVSAQGFHGLEIGAATQVFVPIVMQPKIAPDLNLGPRAGLELRRSRWVNVFARLKAGISVERAQAAIAPLYRQIIDLEVQEPLFQKESENARQQYLKSRMDVFDGSTGRSSLRRDFTKPLYVLMAITGMMLLIACANVANLLIARATARQREIALRLALGASRTQIVMQLMIESLLLSAAATAAGVGLGVWINRILLRFIAVDPSQLTLTAALDSRVLAFSIAIAFATAFIFGLAPALQASRPHLSDTLKSEAGNVFGGRRQAHARKALVMAQVSISLLLLIASSLFVRSLSKLRDVDPGFRKDHVITFSIDPALNGYDRQHVTRFNQDLLDRLRTLPGVRGAGQAVQRVLAGGEWRNGITVEGYEPPRDERPLTHFNAVSHHYFDILRKNTGIRTQHKRLKDIKKKTNNL
jgi:predicted permease